MKKLFLLLCFSAFSLWGHATTHTIQVWNGYFQFLPNAMTIQLGDTIQWLPLDQPTMVHTITSDSIPEGAVPFDQIWQAPADTFFQYVPQVAGLYKYVCTPHISFGMVAQFEVMDISSASEEVTKSSQPIQVFPNPATHWIRISGFEGSADYHIFSLNGELLLSGQSISGKIDISTLTPGLYVIDILGIRNERVAFSKL